MELLEFADLHIDPKWIEEQKSCLNKIIETAEKANPDFIISAGDISNRPFLNSEKDKITEIRNFIKKLCSLSTVVMIPGTPSHDAPGSYGIFEDIGCHILNPAKPEIINDCLFIGLPEIDKISFMSKNKVSMDQANIKINELLNRYIEEFWKPVRIANENIPCIFVGHGMFVDNINDNNPILQNTDIIIDNNKLAEIKADRYIFGHIHTPGESKILNGGYVGYAGFDRSPWNNTGFQPGFNVTEIEREKIVSERADGFKIVNYCFSTETTRIDYPVIRKEKIKSVLPELNEISENKRYLNICPGVDFRINLKIKKIDLLNINIHDYENKIKNKYSLNSCEIIPDIIKEESQRITHEQAEKLKSLWDKYSFFKGWSGNNNPGYRHKINEIEKNIFEKSYSQEEKIIKLLSLKIQGSIFSLDSYNKDVLYHDFSKDPTGLTLIVGDNGSCKSTFFGFANPYPIFIGWDYRSLKEFFPNGGMIEKIFLVNDKIHRHTIYINKKIECFWTVDKEPFLKAISLSDFMEECEKFFGPISSFISISFFAQEPWRIKKYISSIVSSTATELRNAYLEIIGISREAEKLYARDKKDKLKEEIKTLETKKITMTEFVKNKDQIDEKIKIIEAAIADKQKKIKEIEKDIENKENDFSNLKLKYEEQIKIESEINNLNQKLNDKNIERDNLIENIKKLNEIDIEKLKNQIANNSNKKKKIESLREEYQKIHKKIVEIQEDIDCNKSAVNDCVKKIINLEYKIKSKNSENESLHTLNKTLNVPCENCEYIKPENKKVIEQNNEMIKNNEENINEIKKDIKNFKELQNEHFEHIKNQIIKIEKFNLNDITKKEEHLKKQLLSELEEKEINNKINNYSQIKIYKDSLYKVSAEIEKTYDYYKTLSDKYNPFAKESYEEMDRQLSDMKDEKNKLDSELIEKISDLKNFMGNISEIKLYEEKIKMFSDKIEIKNIDFQEWKTIETDMQSNKLPAFELDIIVSEIDAEVNRKLDGRYIIKTNTQDINNKGEIIDRFDIMVYNPKSGIEKSLLAHSPGQRAAYFIEPISQALREKRQQRENIIFTWSISDETDWPIKPIHIRDYYTIMEQGLSPDHTRFIMSQKSEIENFVKNKLYMKEMTE